MQRRLSASQSPYQHSQSKSDMQDLTSQVNQDSNLIGKTDSTSYISDKYYTVAMFIEDLLKEDGDELMGLKRHLVRSKLKLPINKFVVKFPLLFLAWMSGILNSLVAVYSKFVIEVISIMGLHSAFTAEPMFYVYLGLDVAAVFANLGFNLFILRYY